MLMFLSFREEPKTILLEDAAVAVVEEYVFLARKLDVDDVRLVVVQE
jgi:hypothetical protein